MSRLRATAAQILPDCPLVVGFGGWGVLGADLPTGGENPALGREWGEFPADDDAEFWIVVTRQPVNGAFEMQPDTTWTYDGTTDYFEAQLYLDNVAVGTVQRVDLVVGSAQEVLPLAGEAAYGGGVPLVLQPITANPAAGSSVVTGYAPTISQIFAIRPAAGHCTDTGYAPSVSQPQTMAPEAGHAMPSGHTPIVVQGIGLSPQPGRMSISGYTPDLQQGGAITISPSAGHFVATGRQPAVRIGVVTFSSARRLVVQAENRRMSIPAENRRMTIQ